MAILCPVWATPATGSLVRNKLACISEKVICSLAAEHGFSAAYCCAPAAEDAVPPEIRTLIILIGAYMPGGWLVDAFYPVSNRAYHQAQAMAGALAEKTGCAAVRLSDVRLKPVCNRLKAFGRGMNTLNYLPQIGSRFCMELIGLGAETEHTMAERPGTALACGACKRCMHACPTGAITEDGFIREKCIRHYMLSGKPMPEPFRRFVGAAEGTMGIVGCDICQRVCPYNAQAETARHGQDCFSLPELLECTPDTLERFAALYGKNYANRNRIIAQAVLAAVNQGEKACFAQILSLQNSPSALVAEHARWAAAIIKNLQNYY